MWRLISVSPADTISLLFVLDIPVHLTSMTPTGTVDIHFITTSMEPNISLLRGNDNILQWTLCMCDLDVYMYSG